MARQKPVRVNHARPTDGLLTTDSALAESAVREENEVEVLMDRIELA